MKAASAVPVLLVLGALAAAACALNPQPIPPEDDDGRGGFGGSPTEGASSGSISPVADAAVPSDQADSGGLHGDGGGELRDGGTLPEGGDGGALPDAGSLDGSTPDAAPDDGG